jgi:hypothetical protein
MKIKLQVKFNKIQEPCKKACQAIAQHFFGAFLVVFVLVLVIGSIVFYKYSILAQKTEAPTFANQVQFDDDLYQKLLEICRGRGEKFQSLQTKEYPNPF